MTRVDIKATDTTPNIILDREAGNFMISGVSMPNDPIKFYDPIIAWIEEYSLNPVDNAEFCVQLEYFNTASSKIILNIMKKIKEVGRGNKIIWYYDTTDEDIKEVGEDYREMIGEDTLEVKPN